MCKSYCVHSFNTIADERQSRFLEFLLSCFLKNREKTCMMILIYKETGQTLWNIFPKITQLVSGGSTFLLYFIWRVILLTAANTTSI